MDKTQLLPSRRSWSKQESQALPQEASSLKERHALIGETLEVPRSWGKHILCRGSFYSLGRDTVPALQGSLL